MLVGEIVSIFGLIDCSVELVTIVSLDEIFFVSGIVITKDLIASTVAEVAEPVSSVLLAEVSLLVENGILVLLGIKLMDVPLTSSVEVIMTPQFA